MCNKDIKGYKFIGVGVDFIAFNVLLYTKSGQKGIGNWFCAPKFIKTFFFNKIRGVTKCKILLVIDWKVAFFNSKNFCFYQLPL